MNVDYIIIGQGICGSFLSYEFLKEGKSVLVLDEEQPFSATKVASGVINPITGRQAAVTWMAETILPFTWQAYQDFGAAIQTTVIHQRNIIAFPPTDEMMHNYRKRIELQNPYLEYIADDSQFRQWFNFLYQPLAINPVWLIDLLPLLQGWRKALQASNSLLTTRFDATQLQLKTDGVQYQDINAKKIIFCNGTGSFKHPYWANLPYIENKGEAIIAAIDGLPANNIYKFGKTTIVPWYNGLWWIGSTYENNYTTTLPTEAFRQQTIKQLSQVLKLPFEIKEHWAALRPAAVERRPFVGLHPKYPQIGILNGMGTKGCSLAPWFAQQLAQFLIHDSPIDPEADVRRFEKILSR
jgi:glycine/D-amino acid oxidase-like deaminating enzyme